MSQSDLSGSRFGEYIKSCAMPPYNKIAVGIDVSMRSASALRRAVALSKVFCAKLYIIHVISTKLPYARKSHVGIPNEIYEILFEHAKQVLTSASKFARDENLEVEEVLLQGDPAEEILKFVEEKGIDLVVLGRKDKEGTLEHLGSVSNKVATETRSSVLIER
ncbi:MAG: universal stress protein [Candidatus Methanomethylicaceae archaeon]